ncbi:mRNA-capping enzyme subunit beta [Tulasnella sp. 424]|nr:mRNA-capping enzyme subunit beta [Tulasnella sp. 424]KAG8980470.1 mRNA-capping enzyme subunit beta [Tulasnella sp. 425]
MASASRNQAHDIGYYEQHSDPEHNQSNPAYGDEDEEDEEEEEDEDDFVQRPRPDTPPPPPTHSSNALKRKATEPQQQYGSRQPPQTSFSSSLPSSSANGGQGSSEPAAKKLRPDALEPSILAAEPLDEFVLEIADWVHRVAQGKTNIEVEAKVGTLIDTRSNERVNLPVLNETILAPEYPDIRFSSDMTVGQHAMYNKSLNSLVERTGDPNYPNARIRYEHFRLVDTFYNMPAASGGGKVRVTRDEKTGQVKECVQKVRIADLNVYSPKRKMDWRVSVSVETPAKLPPDSLPPTNTRRKDRVSYSHQAFKIDLTQVTTSPDPAHAQLSHELEIEFADPNELMRCARVRTRGSSGATWSGKEGEAFDELIRVFVNNIRIMVRNAG